LRIFIFLLSNYTKQIEIFNFIYVTLIQIQIRILIHFKLEYIKHFETDKQNSSRHSNNKFQNKVKTYFLFLFRFISYHQKQQLKLKLRKKIFKIKILEQNDFNSNHAMYR
jgi:hypothetical protein